MPPKHAAARAESSVVHVPAPAAAAAATALAPARSPAVRPLLAPAAVSHTEQQQQQVPTVSTPTTQSHAAHSNTSGVEVGDARIAAAPLSSASAAASLQRSPAA